MVCKGFYLNKVGLRGIKHLRATPRPFRSNCSTGHRAIEPVLLGEDPDLRPSGREQLLSGALLRADLGQTWWRHQAQACSDLVALFVKALQ